MARNRKEEKLRKHERKKKRNTIIIGILLVALMTVGILGYGNNQNSSSGGSNKFDYNGFDFTAVQDVNGNILFIAKNNGIELGYFYFQPIDTEDIEFSPEFREALLTSDTLAIATEPLGIDGEFNNDRIYHNILAQHIKQIAGKNIIQASSKDDPFSELPYYDCSKASPDTPVIIIDGNATTVTSVENADTNDCYLIHASGIEILKMRDKIIYVMLGIQ